MSDKEEEDFVDIEKLPARVIAIDEKFPRYMSSKKRTAISPFVVVDGKVMRSSLLINRKKERRTVKFLGKDSKLLVDSHLEPDDPWKHRRNSKDFSLEDLIDNYKAACKKNNTEPLASIIVQIEEIQQFQCWRERIEALYFSKEKLNPNDCEALEEIFKKLLFHKLDFSKAIQINRSAELLFEIIQYYHSCTHLVLSQNENIGSFGWRCFERLVKKTPCIKRVEASNIYLNDAYLTIIIRAIRYSWVNVLKLEKNHLSGKLLVLLVSQLKFAVCLRELYLGDNKLDPVDSIHIGTLLRFNNRLQLLDLSNNNIQDAGACNVIHGATRQLNLGKRKQGLEALILCNNNLTRRCSPYINAVIVVRSTIFEDFEHWFQQNNG